MPKKPSKKSVFALFSGFWAATLLSFFNVSYGTIQNAIGVSLQNPENIIERYFLDGFLWANSYELAHSALLFFGVEWIWEGNDERWRGD